MTRAIVLVDGEHYPPVISAALEALTQQGLRPVAALVVGGTEKVSGHGVDLGLGIPTEWVSPVAHDVFDVAAAAGQIAQLRDRVEAEEVYDLSDAPPMDARTRLRLAAHVLALGLPYRGADFRFDPPPRPQISDRPSLAVIGTGKRAGKTAVSGALVRALELHGYRPAVLALGRGGPATPVVVGPGQTLDAQALLRLADAGEHAASDCYEDALTTGAPVVGARRAGGGLAGGVGYSNITAAAEALQSVAHDLVIFEGSGAAVPPAHADATVLVIPADADPELVTGYLGAYRVLLADLVVVTLCAPPISSPQQVDEVIRGVRNISPGTAVLRTVFQPQPLEAVNGMKVFHATTAPAAVGAALATTLESRFGCEVVGVSHRLADRVGLKADLQAAPPFEVLLVELKAAAVDVAARMATGVGARVIFCDNRLEVIGLDDPLQVLGKAPGGETGSTPAFDMAVRYLADLATGRHSSSQHV